MAQRHHRWVHLPGASQPGSDFQIEALLAAEGIDVATDHVPAGDVWCSRTLPCLVSDLLPSLPPGAAAYRQRHL